MIEDITDTLIRPKKSPLFSTESQWVVQKNLAGWTPSELVPPDAATLPESAWEACRWVFVFDTAPLPTVFSSRERAEEYIVPRSRRDRIPAGRYRTVPYFPHV